MGRAESYHRLMKLIAKRRAGWIISLVAVVLIGIVAVSLIAAERAQAPAPVGPAATTGNEVETSDETTPEYDAVAIVAGRTNVWDMAFLPGDASSLLFTERQGVLSIWQAGQVRQLANFADVVARGEGGLLGLAVDPQFAANRYAYICLNSSAGGQTDVRVARLRLDAASLQIADRRDIVTGITANPSGRHSGCRLAFGPDGYLWVGTGDAALADQPQQPRSLNGKILRVDREGRPAADNPKQAGFDQRVYSYGHRNTQGLAFFPAPKNGVIGLSAEHGSTVDDEVNPLVPGNFGWAPSAGYNERGLPMTDRARFPDAIDALWSSGQETQAPSGIAIINNAAWRGWDGAVVIAILKDKHLKVLRLDADTNVIQEERLLEASYGRLRAVVQGPDGNLYVSTDNDRDDKIVRIVPRK